MTDSHDAVLKVKIDLNMHNNIDHKAGTQSNQFELRCIPALTPTLTLTPTPNPNSNPNPYPYPCPNPKP